MATGALRAGDPMPCERDLARTLAVNPAAVGRAYVELADEGLIQPGVGDRCVVSAAARRIFQAAPESILRRVEQELDLARRVQCSLLPKSLPSVPGVSVAAVTQQARAVGGDFYDMVDLGNDRVGLVIGDVAGKGVAAALLMVKVMGDLRSHIGPNATTDEVLAAANALIDQEDHGLFVTALYMTFDAGTGRLTYTNAGHPTPLVVGRCPGRVFALDPGRNLPLGVVADAAFTGAECTLEPGDTVLLYTDGVVEARDSGGAAYGEERLIQLLAGRDAAAGETIELVRSDVARFAEGQDAHDDMTVIALRYDPA
jgi:sigma-B regulation protein RsbU (phosphoserine phosphatase)